MIPNDSKTMFTESSKCVIDTDVVEKLLSSGRNISS